MKEKSLNRSDLQGQVNNHWMQESKKAFPVREKSLLNLKTKTHLHDDLFIYFSFQLTT